MYTRKLPALLLALLMSLGSIAAHAQTKREGQATVCGYVVDAQSKETLIGAAVFSAETFYKDIRNVIEYTDGAQFFGASTGWVNYNLAKSEQRFAESSISAGRWFPYRYDRRHTVNLCLNHLLTECIDFGASWIFYSVFNDGVFSDQQVDPKVKAYKHTSDWGSIQKYATSNSRIVIRHTTKVRVHTLDAATYRYFKVLQALRDDTITRTWEQ